MYCLLILLGIFHCRFVHSLHRNQIPPQPWPLPQQYAVDSTYFILDPDKFFFYDTSKCDVIVDAMARYKKIIFQKCQNSSISNSEPIKHSCPKYAGDLPYLTICVTGSCEAYPYENMDEEYILEINAPDYKGAGVIYSTTVWGALRGLETFSQLIYQIEPGVLAVKTSITFDYPRFTYRGLLLDTSRHFIPISHLLENLDAMSQVKMNVFHWHIVDDQSFPYVSKTFPDLSEKGAFNPITHTYSQEDIARVIEYARLRGIRVVAEFDTPGHTQSWGKGQPNLLTPCYCGKSPNGEFGPIDPTNNEVYAFLKSLFSEIGSIFPENYVHLGGDEVSFDCWSSNPKINKFMKKHGISSYSKLEEFYMQNLLNIVKSLKKSYIVWQEVFDNGVQVEPDTVIHVWKDNYKPELTNVTAAGYSTILSSCWYISDISYGNDWLEFYKCDPHDFEGTDAQKKLIIGGEACMWGEYVDGSNIISRTWPRAAAVAERLWSEQTVTHTSAIRRMNELRCSMIRRGLKVEPVNGPGYCECDYLL